MIVVRLAAYILAVLHLSFVFVAGNPSSAIFKELHPFVTDYTIQLGVGSSWKFSGNWIAARQHIVYQPLVSTNPSQYPEMYWPPLEPEERSVLGWIKQINATKTFFRFPQYVQDLFVPHICQRFAESRVSQVVVQRADFFAEKKGDRPQLRKLDEKVIYPCPAAVIEGL